MNRLAMNVYKGLWALLLVLQGLVLLDLPEPDGLQAGLYLAIVVGAISVFGQEPQNRS